MASFVYVAVFSATAAYIAARNAVPYAPLIGISIPLLYTAYLFFVYPFYFSPFRNIPEPKVNDPNHLLLLPELR